MQFHHKPPFARGFTMLIPRCGQTADMLQDFGVLTLYGGDTYVSASETDEQCWLLSGGEAEISWGKTGGTCQSKKVSRTDLFNMGPWCLSVPKNYTVSVKAGKQGCEWYYNATDNPKNFNAKLFAPEDVADEYRGKGMMLDTSTRIVRTCWDDTTRPESNLVIGEDIGFPGKWSSYPPHHHPQPEIYHYRFLPENGFGLCLIGDSPMVLHERDTVCIREGEVHPHVTAPGYAMWYLWVIRHIDGAHYGPQTKTPIFVPEHDWVQHPGSEKKFFQGKQH